MILAAGPVLGLADLPTQIGSPPAPGIDVGSRITLEQLEAEHIRQVLAGSATIEEASETLASTRAPCIANANAMAFRHP